jgi:hypothetical protein
VKIFLISGASVASWISDEGMKLSNSVHTTSSIARIVRRSRRSPMRTFTSFQVSASRIVYVSSTETTRR